MHLDARTRLSLFLMVLFATLVTNRVYPLGGLLLGGILWIAVLRGFRQWARTLRLLVPMLALFTLFAAIGAGPGDAVAPGLKLLALGTWSTALFVALPVDDLADALTLWHLPVAVSFVLIGGLRYAPMLSGWWADLIDARRARGTEIPRGVKALPVYASLLIPTVVRALRTADEMAEAMESRAFGTRNATPPTTDRMRLLDWALIALGVVLLCVYLSLFR